MMRVVDLFSGAGGFSLGFEQAGFRVVAGFDFDPKALAVHEANFPGRIFKPLGGVRRVNRVKRHWQSDLEDLIAAVPDIVALAPDVIVGGPPCQPWSSSGKRKGDADPRARLTEAFGIVVAASRPAYFVMENVPKVRKSRTYSRMVRLVRAAGYGLTEVGVDASYYGVGQRRVRWLCIGALGEADGFLLDDIKAARSHRQMTVADVLGAEIGAVYFARGHSGGCRRSFRSSLQPLPTITSSMDRRAGTKSGGYEVREADERFFDQLETETLIFLYPGGKSSPGTISVMQPAPTLTRNAANRPGPGYKPRAGDVLDPSALPVLLPEQLGRLAGFPGDWQWKPPLPKLPPKEGKTRWRKQSVTKANQMQMIANAVPPPLARAIANCLRGHHNGRVVSPDCDVPDQYGQWLGEQGFRDRVLWQEKHNLAAAWRILGSRKYLPDTAIEILDRVPAFARLSPSRKSNLRAALRRYLNYLEATVDWRISRREAREQLGSVHDNHVTTGVFSLKRRDARDQASVPPPAPTPQPSLPSRE